MRKRGLKICSSCGVLTSVSVEYANTSDRLCISCAVIRQRSEQALRVDVFCPVCFNRRKLTVAEFKRKGSEVFIKCDTCIENEKKETVMPCGREIRRARNGRCSRWGNCEYENICLDFIDKRKWNGFKCI